MDELDTLKKGKSIDGSYSSGTIPSSSVTPSAPQEPLYGMPTGYFAGQTPPPPTDRCDGCQPGNTHTNRVNSLFNSP